MSSEFLRFRQVHLDFHTSEHIRPIGHKFEPAKFQDALKRGNVDSITIFSKCHHGLSYHDTSIGRRHPGLDFELMPRMIEACRAIGVKCPIYLSAGLDEYAASIHPEWIVTARNGHMGDPLRAEWKSLGFDTPYLDYLCAQIEEVVDNYDAADGIFLDIVGPKFNMSQVGLAAMQAAAVDPENYGQLIGWNLHVLNNYYARTTAACKKGDSERRVFHNSSHIPKGQHHLLAWNSHLELESLPTGGWGYDHFPISAKYAATTGYDFLGMTGKFHTSWGEFGGFKRAAALRYECSAMLAFGSKCSVGDQLHPSGEMNLDTYELIGESYREVAEKEPWIAGATPVSEVGLVSPEALHGYVHSAGRLAEEGAARMLLELDCQFDIIDLDRDLSGYRVVILPDAFPLAGAFKDKVEAYLAGGGKLLLSGTAGMNEAGTEFALDFGLRMLGKSGFDPCYVVVGENISTPPVRGPFVVHGGTYNVAAGADFQVLASRMDPYFNREWNHFCSHQHTPDAVESPYPAVVSNGQVGYFANSIFTAYRQLGQPLYRDLVKDALATLLPGPVVWTSLPSGGRCTLMRQTVENRYVLHLLFAQAKKCGAEQSDGNSTGVRAVEIIEDVFPLHFVQCEVRIPEVVSEVRLVPAGVRLDFELTNGVARFTVPQVLCHQMVELRLG